MVNLTDNSFSSHRNQLRNAVLHVDKAGFEALALQIFRFQSQYNPVYAQYIHYLGIDPESISSPRQIPFLPISFFKTHTITCRGNTAPSVTFESSGTTGLTQSRHALYDPELYQSVSRSIFESQYGPLSDFHILALLPSYLERNNSSLVYMADHFIQQSRSSYAGFYLNDTDQLLTQLQLCLQDTTRKTLLLGVTFALLDLAEAARPLLAGLNESQWMVMETGGMKGRRKEMIREEVHEELTRAFGVKEIHSEYGMTELLSQGYSKGNGVFTSGNTMQILLRDINDPLTVFSGWKDYKGTGGINVIDLANIDSCSFIETQDLGRFCPQPDQFEVIGRFDNSDIRGCNLMVL